jgi:ankyrin repeat protein
MCLLALVLQDGDTPLINAAYERHTKVVSTLLSVGAQLDISNNVRLRPNSCLPYTAPSW